MCATVKLHVKSMETTQPSERGVNNLPDPTQSAAMGRSRRTMRDRTREAPPCFSEGVGFVGASGRNETRSTRHAPTARGGSVPHLRCSYSGLLDMCSVTTDKDAVTQMHQFGEDAMKHVLLACSFMALTAVCAWAHALVTTGPGVVTTQGGTPIGSYSIDNSTSPPKITIHQGGGVYCRMRGMG